MQRMNPPEEQNPFFTADAERDEQPEQTQSDNQDNKRSRKIRKLVLIVLLLTALVIILNETVFTVRHIQVCLEYDTSMSSGNKPFTTQEVLSAAGLKTYPNYFLLNEKETERKISENRYLCFISLEKIFPDRMILTVKQRQYRAYLVVMGSVYMMDEEGMLLEKISGKLENIDLITITGIMPKDRTVGKILVPSDIDQLHAYTAVMGELSNLGILDDYAEMNLSSADDIYLMTKDNYTVHLGNTEEIRPKLKTVMYVLAALRAQGRTGGTLEARTVGEVIYTPDSL